MHTRAVSLPLFCPFLLFVYLLLLLSSFAGGGVLIACCLFVASCLYSSIILRNTYDNGTDAALRFLNFNVICDRCLLAELYAWRYENAIDFCFVSVFCCLYVCFPLFCFCRCLILSVCLGGFVPFLKI